MCASFYSSPFSCVILILYFIFFRNHITHFFLFILEAYPYTNTSTKTNRNATFNIFDFNLRAIDTTTRTRRTEEFLQQRLLRFYPHQSDAFGQVDIVEGQVFQVFQVTYELQNLFQHSTQFLHSYMPS